MKQNPIAFYLFCILTFTSFSTLAQTGKEILSNIEEASSYLKKWENTTTGGGAIAVVKNGEIVFSKAVGMANLEYGIPNTVNTIFHAASLSKQFTTYSILLLEQEGKISLDDDIRDHISEVPDFGKTITLRHLASHTSGLRDQWRLLHLAGWRSDDVILNKDILELVSKQVDLNFEPGSKLMYSNTGFTLLAEVVARVSGKSFAEFTTEHIFTPLGMVNSQFYDDYEKVVANRAYSYKQEDNKCKKNKLSFSTVGATSLFTTVNDLSKWAIHLNTLNERNNILSKKMNQQAHLNNGKITEAAMGQWTGVKYKGLEWFDHTGSDASFRAYFSRFPESNSAVMVLANTTPFDAASTALLTADIFLNEYYKSEPQPTASKEKKVKKKYKFIKLSQNQLSNFCGKFWEPNEYYNREIKVINDTLIYYRSESSQTKLLPVSENEFKMLGDTEDVSVFFEKDNQDRYRMRLTINDDETVIFLKYSQGLDIAKYLGRYYSPEVNGNVDIYKNGQSIFIQLFKQDAVELKPVTKDLFNSSDRQFKKVEFTRNEKGNITGLLLSNGGVINLKYHKT